MQKSMEEIHRNELLCTHLLETVYNQLNLVDTPFSKFFYKDMVDMVNLPGISDRPKMIASVTTQLFFC
jgi:hypothetical protein